MRAFLDDTFVRVPAERVEDILAELPGLLALVGLELNAGKTAIWPHTLQAAYALPSSLRGLVCGAPVVLGAVLERAAGETDNKDGTAPHPDLPDRSRRYLNKLAALVGTGLSAQSALSLLRAWAAGALTHEMRLAPPRPEDWPKLEAGMRTLLGRVLNTDLVAFWIACRVVYDTIAPQVRWFLSVFRGANARAGEAIAPRETPQHAALRSLA